MPTKTQEYLRILAEGGDAPTDCCMTVTQSLIAEAIERINNLGGGAVVPLSDYVNLSGAGQITDLEGLTQAIDEGKGFYLDAGTQLGGVALEGVYNGEVTDTEIVLSGASRIVTGGTSARPVYTLTQLNLHFDKTSGIITPTADTMVTYVFPKATTAPGGIGTTLGQNMLTINIGGDTYEYDGTQDVDITILDGESMGF